MLSRVFIPGLAMLVMGIGCGEDFKPPPESKKKTAPAKKRTERPAPTPSPANDVAADEKEKPPEPTTPQEIAVARNTAILDGRFEDSLRYCAMEDLTKQEEQAVLGCVLSACRLKKTEQARSWAKNLSGALKREAFKVCKANDVLL